MGAHKLDSIFNPKRIAVIGVTTNPRSVSGKILGNLVGGGFRGVVYPVNPDYEAVLGIQCYPAINALPHTPDLAVICTPPEQVPGVVRQCGEAGVRGIIIVSAGFKEVGEKGRDLERQIREEVARWDGMRVIGPNCLGIIVPGQQLNVSFANGMPSKGNIAFISQSGALCTSVLDWALQEKVGFSYFVSIGNTLDVDFGDLIDYFGEDENTRSIILYVESMTNARKFMTAARAFARTKPIIAYKAGRFPESAQVAASHTGALAAEDAVYDAAFQRIGLARVDNIGEIFEVAELIGRQKTPLGPRLGIVTNAGGPGVMATDALIGMGGTLAKLSDETMALLNDNLPPFWSHGNPVDVLGDARAKVVARATDFVLKDKGVDAVLVILTPQSMTNPSATAREVGALAEGCSKPILAAWLGGASMKEGVQILNDAGVATYSTPEQAIGAFMTLVAYARNLETLYETPKDIPVEFTLDRAAFREQFESTLAGRDAVLSEEDSKSLLAAYGIPVTQPRPAATADEAVRLAAQTGYPVVAKIFSPDITHKTEVGGVMLNLADEAAVRAAFDRLLTNAAERMPQARLQGITIQPMVRAGNAVEMILGAKRDPVFGTVIMAGMGGIYAELFKDTALGFPPLNERLARWMLESLKIWPMLRGWRGKPAMNLDKLKETLIRLSYLVADYPRIVELDINPLLVSPDAVVALDARIVTDGAQKDAAPYSHLALRPYPEEYVRSAALPDGTPVLLRPIKPEDEPMWLELLGSCSRESIYQRFRYFFHWDSHDVATRYCFIDYDREIGIVAELNDGDRRRLLGVGRLVADPDHENVEYAVLVTDDWQNRGLGSLLTDYCIEIARHWNLGRIVAQTTQDNPRMINVFRKRGFAVCPDPHSSLVDVELALGQPR